jgi:DNA-binding transcriptional LysR family regulator
LLRTGRGVELTSAGKLFLAQTDHILHGMAKAREQIQLAKSRTSGRVAVAASRPFTTNFFPLILAKFAHAFPDVDVTVFEASSGQVHQYLADSAVDLAVVLHNPNSNLIQTEPLLQEELFLVTRADQAIAKERNVRRADLTRLPLLLPAAFRYSIVRVGPEPDCEIGTIRCPSRYSASPSSSFIPALKPSVKISLGPRVITDRPEIDHPAPNAPPNAWLS